MAAKTYLVYNGPMCTTAPPTKVTTGTATKTMLQLAPTVPIRPIAWGVSFDGSALATPGVVELIDTSTVFATVTASAVADVQTYGDANAPANGSGSTGTPLGLGTALSGYTASAEGSITATRMADLHMIDAVNEFSKDWPLGREFEVPSGHSLRVRVTFGTAVNCLCWICFEV